MMDMNAIRIREAADELLLDHARGAASAPVDLLVATHVALNPAARRRHRCLEAVGGAMLDTIEPVATAPDALDRLFARIDAGHAAEPARAMPAGEERFPAALRARMPGGLEARRYGCARDGARQHRRGAGRAQTQHSTNAQQARALSATTQRSDA